LIFGFTFLVSYEVPTPQPSHHRTW